MNKPKLIFLNGFSGCGKSTLTKKYIDNHKFSLGFEGDNLIVMFGQWSLDWDGAAKLKLLHLKNILRTHLRAGYDVALPFLLTAPEQAEEYATLAIEEGATFHEFYLTLPKEEAIGRLLQRGSWGEPGSPPFTDKDLPRIEALFERMQIATEARPNVIQINPRLGAIEETYQELFTKLQQ